MRALGTRLKMPILDQAVDQPFLMSDPFPPFSGVSARDFEVSIAHLVQAMSSIR
jgi:hypothetical protein